jgi:uncharacterized RDD family membrane protein YckC
VDTIVFALPMAVVLYGLQTSGLLETDSQQAVAPLLSPDARLALLENLLPALITVALWALAGATPGKFLLECRVVDARTGRRPGWLRASVRYLGYFVSLLPLGLGFFWIAWDRRKQGWHDKLAGTLVVVEDLEQESIVELERLVAD